MSYLDSKIVDRKKVRGRLLLLVYDAEDGWVVQFKDDAKPLGLFFDREQEAKDYFDEVGAGKSGKGVVVNLVGSKGSRKNTVRHQNG